MSPWLIFTSAFAIGFSGALMPGPLLSVVIAQTIRWGFWPGFRVVIGHAVADLIVLALFLAGAGTLMAKNSVAAVVALGGGVMLLWMGGQMVAGSVRGTVRIDDHQDGGLIFANRNAEGNGRRLWSRSLVTGITASVSNPYWFLWWATVGSGYISVALRSGGSGLLNAASFYTGHILSDFAWYASLGLAVAGGRRYVNDTVYRVLVGCSGVFLAGMAVYFGVSGVRLLGR